MSLLTLGSAPYNPYNTDLAQFAVSGLKLGMENLDAIDRNNQFYIGETSKAFAAVTDNLFKGAELQLRNREADRMDRAQAFHEYEFGEKLGFDKTRATIQDNQWLKTFDQGKIEFEDTKKRTVLAEREVALREAEHRRNLFNDIFINSEKVASINSQGSQLTLKKQDNELQRLALQDKEVSRLVETLQKSASEKGDQLKSLQSTYNLVAGYQQEKVKAGSASYDALAAAGVGLAGAKGKADVAPTGWDGNQIPPLAPGRNEMMVNIGAKDNRVPRSYTEENLKDLKRKMIEVEEQMNFLSGEANRMAIPGYYGTEPYMKGVERVEKMFREQEGKGTDVSAFNIDTTSDGTDLGQ